VQLGRERVMDQAGVDFAVVAWREEGVWSLVPAPSRAADSVEELEEFARLRQGEAGSLAFVSVAEEFFVAIRIQGLRTRFLLSDVGAVFDWSIADEVAERLELDIDEEADVQDGEPAGDLTLLADFGLSADLELYPDEQIAAIARKVGFSDLLAPLLDDLTPAN
jgi:putative tRNA adenosine deaminase-associated protein